MNFINLRNEPHHEKEHVKISDTATASSTVSSSPVLEAQREKAGHECEARARVDGKEKKRRRACYIMCLKSENSLENVKISEILRMAEPLEDEAPLPSLDEFLLEPVVDLEVSFGELSVDKKC